MIPSFAHNGELTDMQRVCGIGWQVTDFGKGDFEHIGRTYLVLRNGSIQYPKPYCEKIGFAPM